MNSKIIVIEVQERYLDKELIDVPGFEFLLHAGISKETEMLFSAHIAQGNSFIQQGNLKEAIKEFQEAVILRPDYVSGYKRLGNIFQLAGRFDEATVAYRKVVMLDPYDPLAHYFLGFIFQSQEKNQEALSEFQKFIELAPPADFQALIQQATSFILTLRQKSKQ